MTDLRSDVLRLCDAAAEALVLFDESDPSRVAALGAAFSDLQAAFGDIDGDHPVALAASAARAVADGDPDALGRIEGLFAKVREAAEHIEPADRASVAEVASKPKKRAADSPRITKATRTAKAAKAAKASEASQPDASFADDAELLHDFAVRATEHMDDADEFLLALEHDPTDRGAVDAVLRAFHTVKGMAGFLALNDVRDLAHEGEGLLESAQGGERVPDAETLDRVFGMVDAMREAIRIAAGGAPTAAPREGSSAEETEPTAIATVARETIRVDSERLDQLLDAIGELVIAESMVSRTARVEMALSVGLGQQLGRLDKLMRQLHEMAGSLRMIPLRPTFQRMARAARDIAHQADKQVDFILSGAETELDKAVVDRIADPLLHLVRNAVDHGIESARDRVAAGKPACGRVELRAYHKAGSIFVEIEDDGCGLDPEAIITRAREMGLLAEDESAPTERELLGLVFAPGLSTSEEVTDVSGRGVGMDVVKRTIDSLGGQISVRSESGRGTQFIMRLPVTLAVIDGMVIQVSDERYIVPTLSVVRSIRPEAAEITSVFERGETLRLGDELVRLIKLRDVFSLNGFKLGVDESIVMVVESDGEKAGLVIDEIVGQQQIVIKSLGDALGEVAGVSGGAVMPDGRVGLILDVGGLVALANRTK